MADDDKLATDDKMMCVLECITYHDGSKHMRERDFVGPFETFIAAHDAMMAMVKRFDTILIHRLTQPEALADERPSAA